MRKKIKIRHDKDSAEAIVDTLAGVPNARFKFLLRTTDFMPVGTFTTTKQMIDSASGKTRASACGTGLSGKRIDEFLDFRNSLTGALEPTVVLENDFFIITSRKSSDPSDDRTHFQWVNFDRVFDEKRINDEMEENDIIIERLQKEIVDVKGGADDARSRAGIIGSEIRQLKTTVNRMSREIVDFESMNQHFLGIMRSQLSGTVYKETEGEKKSDFEIKKTGIVHEKELEREIKSSEIESPAIQLAKKLDEALKGIDTRKGKGEEGAGEH